MKFDVRYYLVAILFIIFDLEIAFLFPWAIVLDRIGMFGFLAMLLFLEARVVKKGDRKIIINDDTSKAVKAPTGATLLATLSNNDIFLPSACGGGGSCGQCRCSISEGGGDILPTELPHLSRMEKNNHIRLACQVKVREDMKIQIPPEIFSIRKFNAIVKSNQNVATFIK